MPGRPKNIRTEDKSDFLDRIKTADSIFLLLGSAISRPAPSNVPTVDEIKRVLLRECLSRSRLKTLVEGEKRLLTQIDNAFQGIPFETMWEGLRYSTRADTPAGLDALMNVRHSNPLHELVASMLTERTISGVITTNFDCLLEQALEHNSLGNPAVQLDLLITDEDYRDATNRSVEKPVVAKIHGSLRDLAGARIGSIAAAYGPDDLMHTLGQASRGLTDEKVGCIEHLLEQARNPVLVVLGYGGNDLDIQRVLPSLLSRTTILWCCPDSRFLNPIIDAFRNENRSRVRLFDGIDFYRIESNPLYWLREALGFSKSDLLPVEQGPVSWDAFMEWVEDNLSEERVHEFIYWVCLERGVNGPVLGTVDALLSEASGDVVESSRLLFNKAKALTDEHRYFEARDSFEELLEQLEDMERSYCNPADLKAARILEAKSLTNVAYSHRMQHRHKEADCCMDNALRRFYELGELEASDEVAKFQALRLRGEIWTTMSLERGTALGRSDPECSARIEKAASWLEAVIRDASGKGYAFEAAHAARLMAKAELANGNYDEAEILLSSFRTNMYQFSTETGRALACRNFAILRLYQGKYDESLAQLVQARRHLRNARKRGMSRTKVRLETVKLYHCWSQLDIAQRSRFRYSFHRARGLHFARKLAKNDKLMSDAFVEFFKCLRQEGET